MAKEREAANTDGMVAFERADDNPEFYGPASP